MWTFPTMSSSINQLNQTMVYALCKPAQTLWGNSWRGSSLECLTKVIIENSSETQLYFFVLFFGSILVHKERLERKLNKFARKRVSRTFIQFHSGPLTESIFDCLYKFNIWNVIYLLSYIAALSRLTLLCLICISEVLFIMVNSRPWFEK